MLGAPLNTNNHFERPAILSVFTPIARADDMNGATKMPAFRWDCLILCLLASLLFCTNAPVAFAQDDLDDATEEERKQTEAVARFVTVLEKNPRRAPRSIASMDTMLSSVPSIVCG